MNTKITLIREWDSRGRGGAGIYHGPGQIDDVNTPLDNMAERLSLTAAEAPNLAYPVTPFLAQARSQGVTPRSLQRDRRDLYSIQWGMSIQQKPSRPLGSRFPGGVIAAAKISCCTPGMM